MCRPPAPQRVQQWHKFNREGVHDRLVFFIKPLMCNIYSFCGMNCNQNCYKRWKAATQVFLRPHRVSFSLQRRPQRAWVCVSVTRFQLRLLPLFLQASSENRPVPHFFLRSESCCSPAPPGAADFRVLHARVAVWTAGFAELTSASLGAASEGCWRGPLGPWPRKPWGLWPCCWTRGESRPRRAGASLPPDSRRPRTAVRTPPAKHKRRMRFHNQRWCFQPPCFPQVPSRRHFP